ncbi:MAG TPA: cupin, partial [Clostridiales bacterium]|nr:cupin [Clostridiales bacterium]
MEKIKEKKYIWNADDVETWVIPFGKVIVLSDSEDPMSAGIVTLNPGAGHERHNHKGAGEILFVIEGEGEQTVEIDGKIVINKQKVKKGDLIQMP